MMWAVCFPQRAFSKELLTFSGNLDLKHKTLSMNMDFPGNGKADFQAKVARGRIVRFVLKLDHVKTPWFDISSNIYGGWKFIGGKGRKWNVHSDVIQGKIKSYYTLVDYKPFRDLEFIFQAEKDMLIIQNSQ
jgi:hypothetical protein